MRLKSDLERDKDPRAHVLNEIEKDKAKKKKRPAKKHICEDYGDIDYVVSIGFAGYFGVENAYHVSANSEDEAVEFALEEAREDLYVDNVTEIEDGVYSVAVNFAGFRGADETYEVDANDEDDATDIALEEAYDDLTVEDIERMGLDESCGRRRRRVFRGIRRG